MGNRAAAPAAAAAHRAAEASAGGPLGPAYDLAAAAAAARAYSGVYGGLRSSDLLVEHPHPSSTVLRYGGGGSWVALRPPLAAAPGAVWRLRLAVADARGVSVGVARGLDAAADRGGTLWGRRGAWLVWLADGTCAAGGATRRCRLAQCNLLVPGCQPRSSMCGCVCVCMWLCVVLRFAAAQ